MEASVAQTNNSVSPQSQHLVRSLESSFISSVSDIAIESIKISAATITSIFALSIQNDPFGADWTSSSFYHQIRSGMKDAALAGVILGFSFPFLLSGFKRVICMTRGPSNLKIFQGATTVLASLGTKFLALSLMGSGFRKLDMAIKIHEASQKTFCETRSQGIGYVFDVFRKYAFSE